MKCKIAKETALADLNRAIALDPTCIAAYAYRSWVPRGQDSVESQLADLDRVLELNADISRTLELDWAAAKAYTRQASFYERQHDLAAADYSRAIELAPTSLFPMPPVLDA